MMHMKTINYSPELVAALKAFGFDDKESRIYLSGLELGSATVLELSRRTRLPRTTLYPILERMRADGYFRLEKHRRGATYIPERPTGMAALLHAREKQFAASVQKLESIHGTVHHGAGVAVFEGSDGFRQLWQKIFRSGIKEYRIMTSGVGLLEFVHEPYLVKSIIAERIRLGIKSKQLIVDSLAARKIIAKDASELRESRLLPRDTPLPTTAIIFGDEVAFITTRRENMMIVIAGKETAVTLRSVFDLLWTSAAAYTASALGR